MKHTLIPLSVCFCYVKLRRIAVRVVRDEVKLTGKQELFVLGLIEGKSQRQAYIDAGYSTDGKTDNYIDKEASLLLKNRKVFERYNDLQAELKDKVLWTREQSFREYEWLMNQSKQTIEDEGVKHAPAQAFLGALDGMNRMTIESNELSSKKVEKEIELLSKKIDQMSNDNDTTEDKLRNYFEKLGEVIENE